MKTTKKIFVAITLALLCACSTGVGTDEPFIISDDIVQTDSEGQVVSDDSLDWLPRYSSVAGTIPEFGVRPAYPNPVFKNSSDESIKITLGYGLPADAVVKMSVLNDTNKILMVLVEEAQRAGTFSINWDLKDSTDSYLPAGLYRVHIAAITTDTVFLSYGDIQVFN